MQVQSYAQGKHGRELRICLADALVSVVDEAAGADIRPFLHVLVSIAPALDMLVESAMECRGKLIGDFLKTVGLYLLAPQSAEEVMVTVHPL